MSVQASSWAWARPGLPCHLKLTLLAIADACNQDGFGWPSQQRIANLVGCSDRQVRANVQALQDKGLLEVLIRPGSGSGRLSNAYQLAVPEAGGQPEVQRTFEHVAEGGQPEVQRRATGSPGGGQPEVPLPTNLKTERREELNTHCALSRTAADGDTPSTTHGFTEFWEAWPRGMRKRGRKAALGAWVTHKLAAKAALIIRDVHERAEKDEQWHRGYAPMPATYLRGARWEDELDAPKDERSRDGQAAAIFALERFKCPPHSNGSPQQ